VWGRIVVRVRRRDSIPLVITYYDEKMQLARTLTFSNPRTFGGRELPGKLTVVPTDQPAESTVVDYRSIAFDVPLDDEIFSLRNLQR
jgi:hypothetical protein